MKTVIIDNYDSFTYNLSHLVKELGADVTVLRNDRFALPGYLPQNVKRVGVFVDEDPLTVSHRVKQFGLDIVQLHGKEDPRYIGRIRALCLGITVVKALSIASDKDLDKAKAYFGMVEYFLFDTKAKLVGGNGVQFDWSILNSYRGTVPFILSGGITPETDGFIYMVSSAAITGAQKSFDDAKQEYFRRINALNLRNPRMIGFGISNAQTLQAAQDNAARAIIGSKFVQLLDESAGNPDLALDKLFAALSK